MKEHRVRWQQKSEFTCKITAAITTGVLEPCVCRVSVRKVSMYNMCFNSLYHIVCKQAYSSFSSFTIGVTVCRISSLMFVIHCRGLCSYCNTRGHYAMSILLNTSLHLVTGSERWQDLPEARLCGHQLVGVRRFWSDISKMSVRRL